MSESYAPGGSFLVRNAGPEDVFTPEDFTPDQLMYAKTAKDFVKNEVMPVSAQLDTKDLPLMRKLLRQAGELGLLMADFPEEYGGLALDKASCALIAESIAGQNSFMNALNGHTGIGSLPIIYYGSPDTKAKYLPEMAEGIKLGCYCLTEPTAGSDAMACRTKAVLTEDGKHYVLNGTKQFITSAGFADVFVVFAKIDGKHFTGFVLDRDTPGLTVGPEEHKMGLIGSSTTTVLLDDAKVPVENVLGEIGQGHKIAFNILNIGRFKVGAQCMGAAKYSFELALAYTLERKQFGKRIAEFGAIREKIAQMFARIYAAEAAIYRTIGLIDHILHAMGKANALQSIEEYAAECATVKVFGTEALDFVVDEALQCFGGYGYCDDYPISGQYRDSRITRIYEGTNEINRILVPTILMRRDAAGKLPLLEAAKAAATAAPADASAAAGPLGAELAVVSNLKKIALLALGAAAGKHGEALGKQQMLLLRLADLVALAYTAEAAAVRAQKDCGVRGEERALLAVASAKITVENAVEKAGGLARQVLVGCGRTDLLGALAAFAQRPAVDVVALEEKIAAKLVEAERLTL